MMGTQPQKFQAVFESTVSKSPDMGASALFGMRFPETEGTGDASLNPLFTHISFF